MASMSYTITLNARQVETVESALHYYERNLLDMSPYNNMTKHQQTLERMVVKNIRKRIELAKGDQ